MFLEISQNSQENTCARASLLIKWQASGEKTKTLTQDFPREFCEISKNTFFYRTPLVVASDSLEIQEEEGIKSNREINGRNIRNKETNKLIYIK